VARIVAKALPCGSQNHHRRVRYVVGITLDQLTTAQARDDAEGNFAGARALHSELRIATEGIARLSI
jgi:hypothetical protein